jgi:hypothetical protein
VKNITHFTRQRSGIHRPTPALSASPRTPAAAKVELVVAIARRAVGQTVASAAARVGPHTMALLLPRPVTMMAAAAMVVAAAAAATPVEIYVSAAASTLRAEARDGSRRSPFATVFEARDSMRAGLGAGAPRTVFVDGDHHLTEPLLLDGRDSGTAEAPIVWRSRSFSRPARLTGGVKLPVAAFTPAHSVPSGAVGVVKAELYSAAIGLNASVVPGMSSPYPYGDLELFYEGQPMTRARSPNIAPDGTWCEERNCPLRNTVPRCCPHPDLLSWGTPPYIRGLCSDGPL